MKYQCIRGYRHEGRPVSPGDVVDLDPRTAAPLLFYGKVVPLPANEDVIETRDPVVQHRDPVVKRPGRKPRGG